MTEFILPKGSLEIEYMINRVDHYTLPEIKVTMNATERLSTWQNSQNLRRRLDFEARKRERLLFRSCISIPVPDPHTFRALNFEINPIHRGLIFEFHPNVRKLQRKRFSFNVTIGLDRELMLKDYGIEEQRRGHRVWIPSIIIKGTLLFMVHPNGIAVQLFLGERQVASAHKLFDNHDVEMKPNATIQIVGYQQNLNRSVVTDIWCMAPREFCVRYPTLKYRWSNIEKQISGQSQLAQFDDKGKYRRDHDLRKWSKK